MTYLEIVQVCSGWTDGVNFIRARLKNLSREELIDNNAV